MTRFPLPRPYVLNPFDLFSRFHKTLFTISISVLLFRRMLEREWYRIFYTLIVNLKSRFSNLIIFFSYLDPHRYESISLWLTWYLVRTSDCICCNSSSWGVLDCLQFVRSNFFQLQLMVPCWCNHLPNNVKRANRS